MDLDYFNEHGYFIEENVFSTAECDEFIEASKKLESYVKGIHYPQMMPHRTDALYLKALRKPQVVASIAQAVGGTPVGLQTEFFYCKPGTKGFGRHQDNFFVEAPIGAFASAWCALTDVAVENGALIVWPGSHKEGLLPVQKATGQKDEKQDPNANNEETVIPSHYKPINVAVKKGSVVYIHALLVHGSNSNTSKDKWRQVLLNTYIRKGEKFRPGNYAKREPVEL